MREIITKVYKIDEHPDQQKCFEWIRNNWHDLNRHGVDDLIESLKALEKEIGGVLSYSICPVPDRGEHISFKNYNKSALKSLAAEDCPLTGCCWDIEVIEALRSGNISKVLDVLHDETEYIYSDEGLREMCEANDYEFTEDGEVI